MSTAPQTQDPASQEHAPEPRPRASIALLVIATLAVGFTLWAMQEIVLPILLAIFFALVGNPIIRLLQRLRVPRPFAAILLVAGGIAAAVGLGQQLVEPASEWFREVPQKMR